MSDLIVKPNIIINHTATIKDKRKGKVFHIEFYKNTKGERFSVFEDKSLDREVEIDLFELDFDSMEELIVLEEDEDNEDSLVVAEEDEYDDGTDDLTRSLLSELVDETEEEKKKSGIVDLNNNPISSNDTKPNILSWDGTPISSPAVSEEQITFKEAWDALNTKSDLGYDLHQRKSDENEEESSVGQISEEIYNMKKDRDFRDRHDLGTLVYDYILEKPAKGIIAKREFGESKLGIEFSVESGKVFNVTEKELVYSDYSYADGKAIHVVKYIGSNGEKIEEIKSLSGDLLSRKYETDDMEIVVYVKSFKSFMMGFDKYQGIDYRDDVRENLKAKNLANFKRSALKTVNLPKIEYFKSFLNLDYVEKAEYEIYDTENKLIDLCDEIAKYPQEHVIGYDAESTGLKFHRFIPQDQKSVVVTHSLSWKDNQSAIIPIRMRYTKNIPPHIANHYLKPILEKRVILAHNGAADARFLKEEGIDLNLEEDTMVLAKHLFPYIKPELGMGLALDYLTRRAFNVDMIDLAKYVFNPAGIEFDFSILNEDYMIYYGCPDTDLMRRLFKIMRPKLEARQEQPYRATVKFSKTMGVTSTYNGIGIDMENMVREKEKALDTIDRLEEMMYKLAGETKDTLSLTSSKQVSNYIYGKLGVPVTSETKRTETGLSADKIVIERLAKEKRDTPSNIFKDDIRDEDGEVLFSKDELNAKKYPFCALLRKHADLSKNISAYYNGILNNSINGIYHPEPRIARTDTYRTTERTQITKSAVKKYLGAYNEDWYVCSMDYAAEEFRLAANQSEDEKLIEMLMHPESDPHSAVASELNGIEEYQVDKELRGQTKAANFGIIYGMKAFRLACSIYKTEHPSPEQVKVAGELYKLYCYKRRVMLAELEKARNFVRKNGYLYNKLGYKMIYEQVIDREDYERQIFDPDLKEPPIIRLEPEKHKENIGKLMTVSGNYPIQSWASGILIERTNIFYELLKKHGLEERVFIPITVHDEADLVVHKSVPPVLLLKLLKEAYETDLEYLGKRTARLFIGVGFAYTWGHAKGDDLEIPVNLQNILVDEYDKGMHREPMPRNEIQGYFEYRIKDYMVSRIRETLKDTIESKVYKTGEVEDKLSLDLFVGKKSNELFKYIEKDSGKYNHDKLLETICKYTDSLEPTDFDVVFTESRLKEMAQEKEANKIVDFFFTPILHPRVSPAGQVLVVDVTGLTKQITNNLIKYVTSFTNNEDINSKKLAIKIGNKINTYDNIKILGLPMDSVDKIEAILKGRTVEEDNKPPQKFNNDVSAGNVLYFYDDKTLVVDVDVLEAIKKKDKLNPIISLLAQNLSKEVRDFELMLRTGSVLKRTGYYLTSVPNDVYQNINQVLA